MMIQEMNDASDYENNLPKGFFGELKIISDHGSYGGATLSVADDCHV